MNKVNELITNKSSSSDKNYKQFIGDIDDYKIKPFCITLPQTSAYVKSYNGGTKLMYFSIEDVEILKQLRYLE